MKLAFFLGFFVFSSLGLAAPQVLFSGVNVAELTNSNSSATFTLIAADTAGSDSLAGAVLTDPSSGATYSGFSVGTQKGTYLLSLTLEAIETVRPIEPSATAGEKRVFRITVFNSLGESASVDVSINLDRNVKYTQLPANFFQNLPAEIKDLNHWNNFIGQRNMLFSYTKHSSLRVEYLESKKLTTLARDGWRDTILVKRSGRELFEEFGNSTNQRIFSCSNKDQNVLVCSFEILCTEKNNGTVDCWKVKKPLPSPTVTLSK